MDIADFKIEVIPKTYGIVKLMDIVGNTWALGYSAPTMNCQLATIANAYNIIRLYDEKNTITLDIFKLLYKAISKSIFLLDIQLGYEEGLMKIFGKEDIISRMSYISTNGSAMVIILLKTTKLQ